MQQALVVRLIHWHILLELLEILLTFSRLFFQFVSCGTLKCRSEEVRRASVGAELFQVVGHELADLEDPLAAEVWVAVDQRLIFILVVTFRLKKNINTMRIPNFLKFGFQMVRYSNGWSECYVLRSYQSLKYRTSTKENKMAS